MKTTKGKEPLFTPVTEEIGAEGKRLLEESRDQIRDKLTNDPELTQEPRASTVEPEKP